MECYICYDKESSSDKFVNDPCKCKGSNKIHTSCLKKLIEKNGSQCSICKHTFSLPVVNKNHIVDNYRWEDERIKEQRTENYSFEEDNQSYRYEDKDNIIYYTYIGDGTYRVRHKQKNTCVIS